MYGSVRVSVEDFTVLVDYTIRKFCVQYVSIIVCAYMTTLHRIPHIEIHDVRNPVTFTVYFSKRLMCFPVVVNSRGMMAQGPPA
jgi:hypothetical protein